MLGTGSKRNDRKMYVRAKNNPFSWKSYFEIADIEFGYIMDNYRIEYMTLLVIDLKNIEKI